MDRLSLTAFWRSLIRHRLYAALNIGGLGLGIAVFLVLALFVRFETAYEKWIPGWADVYLIGGEAEGDIPSLRARQASPIAALTAIKQDLPATVGTRVLPRGAAVIRNGVGVREQLALVDPQFFDVFPLKPVAGTLPRPFADPSQAVIVQPVAEKYFGSAAAAIGGVLPVLTAGKRVNYRVAAVVEAPPEATALTLGVMAPLVLARDPANPDYLADTYWNYQNGQTFVRLPGAEAAQRFRAALPGVVRRHLRHSSVPASEFRYGLLMWPIAAIHFQTPGAALMAATLGIIGVLTLLVAAVNYVNLATARAGLRAREVGMRKVLGADRATLMRQYLGEAVATAAIAAVLGLALAELGVPLVNAATGLKLSISYLGADGVLVPLALLALALGAAAGLYPAVVLSRVPAAAVLASARSPGGGRAGARVREGLVVFQFAVTIALITGTAVLVAQTAHVREADRGYDRQQLMLVRSFASASLDKAQRAGLLRRFAELPGARGVSAGGTVPGLGVYSSSSNYPIPGRPGEGPAIETYSVAPGFFDVLGGRLLAGRLLERSRAADFASAAALKDGSGNAAANVVINRAAARVLGFASPAQAAGRMVGDAEAPRTIVGVVEDMRVGSARTPVSPTMYLMEEDMLENAVAVVRFEGDASAFLAAAQAAWRGQVPQIPFEARTAVQALDQLGRSDDQMANLFGIGAGLAVAIGCVGLWGLASFTTARRVREIGVRKTLGASSADVARLLVGQFLRPVLLANLVAWPLAFVAMRFWLAGFDDRIALSPLYFVGASLVALVVAVATVLGQSIRASRATPAWALRHE